MAVFLILAGFVAFILYRQISAAFLANPGLNGLILGVLLIGIVLAIRQVVRLFREVRWVNDLGRRTRTRMPPDQPVLLAPDGGADRQPGEPHRRFRCRRPARSWIRSARASTRAARSCATSPASWSSSACSAPSGA